MPTVQEQLSRMQRTADDLSAALRGQPEAAVAGRPAETAWAAKEIICHLRDTEDLFLNRFQAILAENEPKLSGPPENERMATERGYLKDDAQKALETFRAKRQANLRFLQGLTPAQLERGGLHPTRGRMTVKDFVAVMASHDDAHLDQLKRALDGKA
jgi:uncharacterized damage-inducible protein DinB